MTTINATMTTAAMATMETVEAATITRRGHPPPDAAKNLQGAPRAPERAAYRESFRQDDQRTRRHKLWTGPASLRLT